MPKNLARLEDLCQEKKQGLPPPEVMEQFKKISDANPMELKQSLTPEEKRLAELSNEIERIGLENKDLLAKVTELKSTLAGKDETIDRMDKKYEFAKKSIQFHQEVEVKGIKIYGHFDTEYDTYVLYFPDVKLGDGINNQIIMVSTEPEIAKKAFNHAIELASAGKTTEEVYKESEDYINNLEIPSEKRVGEKFNDSTIEDL